MGKAKSKIRNFLDSLLGNPVTWYDILFVGFWYFIISSISLPLSRYAGKHIEDSFHIFKVNQYIEEVHVVKNSTQITREDKIKIIKISMDRARQHNEKIQIRWEEKMYQLGRINNTGVEKEVFDY